MAGFQDAVNWFYHWQRSEIVGTDLEQRLLKVFNPSLSQTDWEGLVDGLLLEHEEAAIYPELLVQIGVRYRRLGSLENGLEYISLAVEEYLKVEDIHHLSCLRWMYGCVLWQTGNNLEACRQWRMAIDAWVKLSPVLKYRLDSLDSEIDNARMASLRFIDREDWHRQQSKVGGADVTKHEYAIDKYQAKTKQWQAKLGELTVTWQGISIKYDWYRERIHEMGVSLFCQPEEAYLLVKDLAQAKPDRLSKGFIAQCEAMENFIAERKPDQAAHEVECMIAAAAARTPVEKAETYLVSSWAMFRVSDDRWAQFLQKAIFFYPPDSLARVWARWLLGAIQWGVSEKRGDAAEQWMIAMRDLTQLKERAEWQNQPQLVNDFMDKLTTMQDALDLQRNNLA
jgi:hypothetical protein